MHRHREPSRHGRTEIPRVGSGCLAPAALPDAVIDVTALVASTFYSRNIRLTLVAFRVVAAAAAPERPQKSENEPKSRIPPFPSGGWGG